MPGRVIYLVCAEGEEALADQLAGPLRNAGYVVAHNGTIAIGESRLAEAEKAIASGSPIVLCATVKTMGSAWSHMIINAAHGGNPVRVFVVQMERQAYVEQLALDGKIARYCNDPAAAINALLEALAKNFPPVESRANHVYRSPVQQEPGFLDRPIDSATLDIRALERFRSELRSEIAERYPPEMTAWEFLSREGLWVSGNLTRTGALLFATNPTVACQAAMVKCAHYRGIDRSASREIATFEGTVPAQIVAARQFVADRVRSAEAPSADRAQLTTAHEYPMVAVREIIANALVHRNYNNEDANVHIRLFADRLEVSSPGTWVGRDLDPKMQYDLSSLIGQSIKRNYHLAHVLSYISLVEGEGSGIPAALRSCIDNGSPTPTVLQEDGFVTVILRPHERGSSSTVSFAQLLRQFRVRAELTQEELAESSGVSVRAVSDLERGVNEVPRKETVRLLADALRLTGWVREDFEAAARGGRADGLAPPTKALPRDTSSFTGREPELRELADALNGTGATVDIYAIGGMAGIGKTALAVHAAHRLVPQFPDGQIYLHLHAHTTGQDPVEPADALASLLQTVGVAAHQTPAGLEARASLWRDHAVGKRLLLVLDDAADSDQVRPLLPGTAGSLVLVTSRRRLTALEGAVVISLDALSSAEAAELLVRLAARSGLDVNDPAVDEICRSCGYLPLAIGLVAGRMRHHQSWSTADFATDLAAAQDRLAPMRGENLSVAAAFELSYRDLSADQQRMFRRLGLHPGTDIDAYAAAALDDITLNAARTQLEALFDHYLLAEPARDRFRFHDLIREYARQLADAEPAEERAGAIGRLLDYYLYTGDAASRQLRRGHHLKSDVTERTDALAWMSAEWLNPDAVAGSAKAHGKPAHAAAIPAAMHTFLRSQGHWDQAITLQHSALDIAREMGVKRAEARALTNLGDMQYLTDNYPAAEASLRTALQMCTELDDRVGQADALRELGAVQLAMGEYDAAGESLTRALEKYMSLGDRVGEADALREIGAVQQARGGYQDAAACLDRALKLYRTLEDRLGEADALSDIGTVWLACGDYDSAARSQRQALGLYQVLGDRLGEANALAHLGTVQQMGGAHEEAKASLDRAVVLYRGLGDASGEAEALNNLGELALRTADHSRARELHERALAIATRIVAPREQARAHEGIGRSYLAEGQGELGETSVRQAVQIYQQIGSPHAARAAKLLRRHTKETGKEDI